MLENKRILKGRRQAPSSQQRIEPVALVQSLSLVTRSTGLDTRTSWNGQDVHSCRLTRNVDERLMIYSPRNVAVQVLVQSTAAAMEQDNIKYPHCEIASLCPHPSPDMGISNPSLL